MHTACNFVHPFVTFDPIFHFSIQNELRTFYATSHHRSYKYKIWKVQVIDTFYSKLVLRNEIVVIIFINWMRLGSAQSLSWAWIICLRSIHILNICVVHQRFWIGLIGLIFQHLIEKLKPVFTKVALWAQNNTSLKIFQESVQANMPRNIHFP